MLTILVVQSSSWYTSYSMVKDAASKDQTISVNRKAYHDYDIQERIEAGIVLKGTEIKSIRNGNVNLRESYARPDKGELWLLGAHIAQYSCGNKYNHEPKRPRKLLLNRKEINVLSSKVDQKGLTLVPLRVYLKGSLAKIELGIGRGKKVYDKRHAIAKKDSERELGRTVKLH